MDVDSPGPERGERRNRAGKTNERTDAAEQRSGGAEERRSGGAEERRSGGAAVDAAGAGYSELTGDALATAGKRGHRHFVFIPAI